MSDPESENSASGKTEGLVFNIQRFCLHDGPGIRTTVFLKGCPLSCRWCDNPEALNAFPELGFSKILCNRCGQCADICRLGAIDFDPDGMPRIDRKRCTVCGDCVPVCDPQALAVYGKSFTAEEVFRRVQRDALFYDSEGGVTLSGGEPLQQPEFVVGLFTHCRKAGISTAIETSGFVAAEVLQAVLKITDLVLFDLKHMDSRQHRKLTGQSCRLIHENARMAVKSKANVQFRMPLVPGLNSGRDNLRATIKFLREIQKEGACIELMPYHRLGVGKYEALDKVYHLDKLSSPEPGYIEEIRRIYERSGIRCLVSR